MAATKNGKGEGRPQKKPTPPPGSQIYVFYRFLQLGLFQMSWNCALWAGRFITPHAYIPTENKIRPTMGPQNWRNWGQIAVLGSLLLKKRPDTRSRCVLTMSPSFLSNVSFFTPVPGVWKFETSLYKGQKWHFGCLFWIFLFTGKPNWALVFLIGFVFFSW